MAHATPQPTILVKKSDGSTARMTLDEVKEMKKVDKPLTNAPASERQGPRAEPPSQPQPKAFVDYATGKVEAVQSTAQEAKKPLKREDVASPLEEKLEKSKVAVASPAMPHDIPLGPADEAVESILKKAGWAITPDVKNRLSPLIVSRLKDVRTDPQFLVHAMTPTHRGGVGLSPDQAEKLLAVIQSLLPRQKQELGISKPSGIPAKPVMRDIIAPPPRVVPERGSMGPKEEFAAMTVLDFRRFGATIDASLSRFKEKFDALKTESYMVFLDARDGWYESPLYRSYIETVVSAIKEKKKLADAIPAQGSKDQLTMDVVKAIVEMNRYISV